MTNERGVFRDLVCVFQFGSIGILVEGGEVFIFTERFDALLHTR